MLTTGVALQDTVLPGASSSVTSVLSPLSFAVVSFPSLLLFDLDPLCGGPAGDLSAVGPYHLSCQDHMLDTGQWALGAVSGRVTLAVWGQRLFNEVTEDTFESLV